MNVRVLALLAAATFPITGCGLAIRAARADSSPVEAGRDYAAGHCSECHSIGPGFPLPTKIILAPDFEIVANLPTTTAAGLNIFLTTPHGAMPNLMLGRPERRDVIAYILSLRRHKSKIFYREPA